VDREMLGLVVLLRCLSLVDPDLKIQIGREEQYQHLLKTAEEVLKGHRIGNASSWEGLVLAGYML
jgi:hypothetical protein